MLKLNKKKLLLTPGLLVGVLLLASLPLVTQALFEDGKKNIYIGSEEVIEGNFIQTGGIVDFNGQAQKDVIIAGGTINITGPVKGDVIVTGGNIKIKGEVEGNVRVAGGTIEIDNKVGKNVTIAGGTAVIGENAEVGWDVLVFGGSIEMRGKVGGNIKGGGGNAILANEVGGNVNLRLDSENSQLILYPQPNIKGNLTYRASQKAEIKEGAQVAGETIYKPPAPLVTPIKKASGVSYLLSKILGLLALIAVGLLIILLARKKSKEVGERMLDKPWANLGWGLIYLIITPIVLILVAITVIGIPLSLIVLALYLIALYITKVFIGIALGQKLLKWWSKKQEVSLIRAMILGVVLFSILVNLPFVGWIIWLLGICWALGAMVETKKQILKRIEG
ncbi:carbohydrate-binding domain-containing protein [Patescibacteria group bacterium AH-259-L07]|nr:carbohydrate-binding domain-containing protein [Patescibacteria group bacterium AH-259-L07]